jgi:hypothetical protein
MSIDDLRKEAVESYEQSDQEQQDQASPAEYFTPGVDIYSHRKERLFLGMTALQRFVLALILFMMTCVLGAFCLILTEKIVLPF